MFVLLRQWNDIWRGFYRLCQSCALRMRLMLERELVRELAQ